MGRNVLFILFLLLFVTILTGCWSHRELNELGIVVGMGMDKIDNEYEVSVQIVDPGNVSSKKGGTTIAAPVTLHSAKGRTVAEAVRRLTGETSRKPYYAHVRIFLLSEEVARGGIRDIMDFISRDHEFRTDFYIAVAKGVPAKQLLSVMSHLEKIPANKIYNTLELAEKEWSPVVGIKLHNLINCLVSQGRNLVLTSIQFAGNREKGGTKEDIEGVVPLATLRIGGGAAFKGDKLVGWLNEKESRGYAGLTNKVQRTVVEVVCPDGGRLAVNVIRSNTKIRGRVNNESKVEVRIRTEADVSDVECKIDLTKNETIAYLQKKAGDVIKENVIASINKAKKLKSDIFGFGAAIHRRNPTYWNKVKDDWDSQFSDLKVEINVDVRIRRLGTIGNSIPAK